MYLARVSTLYVGVAERFSGRLKPYDNGGSIPSSHTKWMGMQAVEATSITN